MTVRAEIDSYTEAAKALDEEKLAIVQSIFPKAHKSGEYLFECEGVVDVAELMEVCERTGLKATIKPHKGSAFHLQREGLLERISKLESDGQLVKDWMKQGDTIVQVHAPNLALLSMNCVDLLENACTEELQTRLTEGWRILAVCPPFDERRPTYIIGKYEPDEQVASSRGGRGR